MRLTRIMRAAPRGDSTGNGSSPAGSAGRQLPSGGKWPSCGAGRPSASTSRGQTAAVSGLASSTSARRATGGGSTSGSSWWEKKEEVGGVGGAPADIERFGEAEVLGQRDELGGGKSAFELGAAIGRTVIDDDHLQGWTGVGLFEGAQAALQERGAVAGDHHHGDAGRLFCLRGIRLGRQANRIARGVRGGGLTGAAGWATRGSAPPMLLNWIIYYIGRVP